MIINKGTTDRAVELDEGGTKTLPFAIKLADFRLEYYQPGQLFIQTNQGQAFKIPAEPGMKYTLDSNLGPPRLAGPSASPRGERESGEAGSVEIVRKFENFKLIMENSKRVAIEDPNGGPNPALELRLIKPNGAETTRYVFERFPGHARPEDNIQFAYRRMIRDYISDVEVVKDNKVLIRKSIEVNKPLHFEGYLFYQQGYDDQAGRYTVLRVTSDRGLGVVYLGYILLCAGVFWHLWFRHVFGDRMIED